MKLKTSMLTAQAADFIEGTYNIRWLEQFLANQPDPPHLGQNPQLEGS